MFENPFAGDPGVLLETKSTFTNQADGRILWPLPVVLQHVPIGRSNFLKGVKEGRFPKPVRLSPRRVAWIPSEIEKSVAALAAL